MPHEADLRRRQTCELSLAAPHTPYPNAKGEQVQNDEGNVGSKHGSSPAQSDRDGNRGAEHTPLHWRRLQPAKEVFCHYFRYQQREADIMFDALVRKTGVIHDELGSAGQVTERHITNRLADSGIGRGQPTAMAKPSETRAMRNGSP